MPTTPGGLPYPLGTDPVANGAQDIQDLAEAVDTKLFAPGVPWETWTPTLTSSVGSYTTATVNSARYGRIGTLVHCQIIFTITTIGSASGNPIFTLPITATNQQFIAIGQVREIQNTGLIGIVSQESTTTAAMRRYDNAAFLAAGNKFAGSFFYEAA